MAHATNEQEMLLQKLKDAGCSPKMIESCVILFQQNNTSEMKRLLAGHRLELLEAGTEREVFTLGYEEIEKRAAEMGLPVYQYQRIAAQRALWLTTELNFQYHEPEEVTRLFSELIGKPVGEGFCLFPPFYTDYGQNITIGKMCFSIQAATFKTKAALRLETVLSLDTMLCWLLSIMMWLQSVASIPIQPLS